METETITRTYLIEETLSFARIDITVDDHGPGVPEDALNKLFEPFYQVDGSRPASVRRLRRWFGNRQASG